MHQSQLRYFGITSIPPGATYIGIIQATESRTRVFDSTLTSFPSNNIAAFILIPQAMALIWMRVDGSGDEIITATDNQRLHYSIDILRFVGYGKAPTSRSNFNVSPKSSISVMSTCGKFNSERGASNGWRSTPSIKGYS